MSETAISTTEIFMDTTVQKLNQQDQKIQALEEKITVLKKQVETMPDHSEDFKRLNDGLAKVMDIVTKINFPVKAVQELSYRLDDGIKLLKQPVENTVLHHHHVPKIIWITAGLFLALCLACCGWYITSEKLGRYMGNDIKYRYLKLKSSAGVSIILYHIDSTYRANNTIGDSVTQWEEDELAATALKEQLRQKNGEGSEIRSRLEAIEKRNSSRRGE